MDRMNEQETYRHQFRAEWHDYNDGIYYITICTQESYPYFGQIYQGSMILSPCGEIAKQHLEALDGRHADVDVMNYVLMPNHIHMMVAINPSVSQPRKKVNENQGCLKPRRHEAPSNQDFHFQSRLAVVMRLFKGGIRRDCGKAGIEFEWQGRFYDHIVRSQRAINIINLYIDNNIEEWWQRHSRPNETPDVEYPGAALRADMEWLESNM